MLTKIITTDNEFYALENDWESLQEQDPDITFYSTFEYNKTWWDVYKNDENKSLFIICAYNNNKITGIAPLIIEKVSKLFISYNVLKFMGYGDYLNILIERKDKNEFSIIKSIIEEAASSNNKYDRIQLLNIKYNSILAAYFMRHKQFNDNFKFLIECPVFLIKNFLNYEDYKKSCIYPNVNKYKNRLKNKCKYKFIVLINESNQIFDRLSELHIKEQEFINEEKNTKARKSLFNYKNTSDFIRRVYDKNNNIIIFALKTEDEDIIIYTICYLYKRVIYSWNTAFDINFSKYCAGKIFNHEIIEYIFKNDIADAFDFGAGRYPWKFEFTRDFNINYQLIMWNTKTLKGRMLKYLYKIKDIITRSIHSFK